MIYHNNLLLVFNALVCVGRAQLTTNETQPYVSLDLPAPANWVLNLGSVQTISTYYEPEANYNATSWTKYIIEECKRYDATSCVTNSQLTRGAYNAVPPYRVWFGIICGGPPLTSSDFRRDTSENSQIRNATAYVKPGSMQSSMSAGSSASASTGKTSTQASSKTASPGVANSSTQSSMSSPTTASAGSNTQTVTVTTTTSSGFGTATAGNDGLLALLLSVLVALGI